MGERPSNMDASCGRLFCARTVEPVGWAILLHRNPEEWGVMVDVEFEYSEFVLTLSQEHVRVSAEGCLVRRFNGPVGKVNLTPDKSIKHGWEVVDGYHSPSNIGAEGRPKSWPGLID